MADIVHQDLLLEINDFIADTGKTKSAFGLEAVKDPSFVSDIENGRECRKNTLKNVRAYMAANTAPDQAGAA